jgi:hypothetical protein
MNVVIGSQSDVPDVGDPIVSPWMQDTAKKIVHVFASTAARDAWVSPPDGAICQAPAGKFYNRIGGAWVAMQTRTDSGWQSGGIGQIGTGGTYDLLTVGQGVTFDHPTRVAVQVVYEWGFGPGDINAGPFDIFRFSDNTVRPTQSPVVCKASTWQYTPLSWGWSVPTGQQWGFKVRATAPANTYLNVAATWTVQHD